MAGFPVNPIRSLVTLFGYGSGGPPRVYQRGEPVVGPGAVSAEPGSSSDAFRWFQNQVRLAGDRLGRYNEFDAMADDDILSACLRLYVEDSTQPSPATGRRVWCSSRDESLERGLNQTLDDLEMEEKADQIAEGIGKYGDHFESVLQSVNAHGIPVGIAALKSHNPYQVARVQDRLGRIMGYAIGETAAAQAIISPDGKDLAAPWDFVHWRLGTMAPRDPAHGRSLYFSVRQTFKYLKIMEQSMVYYRARRHPDRLKWELGAEGMTPEEWRQHSQTFIQNVKRRTIQDRETGEMRGEQNPLCFTGDTKISLLDGTEVPIRDLATRKEPFWVYAYDLKRGEIVPGRATALGMTGRNARLVEVELDSGDRVRCTPWHRWLLRDGSYKQARDLVPGDSLMPLYRRSAGVSILPKGTQIRPGVPVNHRVMAVRMLSTREDVYDITVEGHHNFALSSGVFVHNSLDDDIVIPKGEGIICDVSRMDGSGNVGTIFDIEWERKKLFGCMRIPPDFMGFADTSGTLQAATPLANQSIRYARGVRSLQHAEILGVVTLLEIDLSMKGLDPHDPKNEFSVHMHPPSYLEEKEQAEAAKIKAETIDIMLEMGEKMGIDRQRWFQHVAEVAGLPEELILSADVKKPEGRKERLSTRIARWHTTQLMLLEAHLPSTVRSRDYPLRMGLSIPKAGGGGYEHVGIFGGYSGERVLKTINEAVVTYDESRKAMSATASEG